MVDEREEGKRRMTVCVKKIGQEECFAFSNRK